LEKRFTREWILSATARVDKNENYDWLVTPAASVVWSPDVYNYLRLSFSAAIRNPTLTDQFLNLDVGRATLLGNLTGFDSLLTVESFIDYLSTNFNRDTLVYFNAPPIRPEKAKTLEVGYRTTLFDKLYIDAGYYFTWYDDFIGFNLGVDTEFSIFGPPINTEVYRVSANSTNRVTTQGFAIGMNYYFGNYYMLTGNYSWNKLNKTFPDDPIIPAFNTPEHKFNIGISGRNVPVNLGFARLRNVGFNVNYKWIQGFLFENSPQFTGSIDDYALLDAQVNVKFDKLNTTFKVGASNLLNNKVFQTYGGPRIGRLAYISILYDYSKR
ncbi:MAG: TonB-dependent receptor, partial [Bacteroidetes bacterium]